MEETQKVRKDKCVDKETDQKKEDSDENRSEQIKKPFCANPTDIIDAQTGNKPYCRERLNP
jgi:hypothetical protein